MDLFSMTVGSYQENTYFLINDDQEALIFDPGDEAESLMEAIEEEGLTPVAILLTHGHLDHIGAVDALRDKYQIPAYIHELEGDYLTDPQLNGSVRDPKLVVCRPADAFYPKELGPWKIGGFEPHLVHVPGHSPGSVAFIFPDFGFVIGGDVLFQGSIGRYDVPGADGETLLRSIQKHFMPLPDHFVVFPGHGEATTMGEEKASNPFLLALKEGLQ